MAWSPDASRMGLTGPSVGSPDEVTGAARIKWGALVNLLGLALAIGGVLLILFDVGLGVANISASGYVSLLQTILLGVLLVVAGVVLGLLAFVVYVAGFGSLRRADPRFRTPMVLGVIGLLGLVLILGFTGIYAASISAAIACPSSNSTCQNNATSLGHGEVAIGYLGGFLGFIGLIGTIVGLYRFGGRYSSTVTKVGAILYIIPFVCLLAPLLVLIGATGIQRKLVQPAPPPLAASPPFAPPPPG